MSRQRSILIPHADGSNRYTRNLAMGYAAIGYQALTGRENFVNDGVRPHVIHLQWPEEHYRWSRQGTPEQLAQAFIARLDLHLARGALLAWTVHNLGPHEHFHDAVDHFVYQSVIDRASIIAHHCPASARLLQDRYRVPDRVRSLLTPHGNYCDYSTTATRSEARRALGIAENAFVFLLFGRVRLYKGVDFVMEAFRRANIRNKLLIVAGPYVAATTDAIRRDRLRLALLRLRVHPLRWMLGEVPDDQVQPLVAASDALVLGHRAGLNSGVAVLGMSLGRPVIGPAIGCLEWVLKQGTNFTYPVGDMEALKMSMEHVASADLTGVEKRNIAAAKSWDWTAIASTLTSAMFDEATDLCSRSAIWANAN